MSTVIRPELSKKNPYYISKHRYYELKHFCLQYPEWAKQKAVLDAEIFQSKGLSSITHTTNWKDRVSDVAIDILMLERKMNLIQETCQKVDATIADYIFECVTKGKSYTVLKTKYDIPCGKDYFYERYHKFFWLLDKDSRNLQMLL